MNMNKLLKYGFMAVNIILTTALFVGGGVLLGLYLDSITGKGVIFTIAFSLLGLGFGVWSMISTLLKMFNSR